MRCQLSSDNLQPPSRLEQDPFQLLNASWMFWNEPILSVFLEPGNV